MFDWLKRKPKGAVIELSKADIIGAVKIKAHPVEVVHGPAPPDSDMASPEAAEAAIARIQNHLDLRKRMGKDQSENCDQLRDRLKRLNAYLAYMKA